MSMTTILELQARYLSGEHLSSEEADCLLQWLNENPDARQEMLIDEAIDNQLRCMARINDVELVEKFVRDSVDRAVAMNGAVASQQSESLPIVIQTRERKNARSYQLFSVLVSLCTAALVFVGIAVAWYATQGKHQTDFGFAHLANSKSLSWELIDGESRRLNVSSGSGEVHFDNGTIAELSSPGVFDLRTPSNLFVESGSVKLNVPPAAAGFTVETPTARIVDLGTEFDVDVGRAGQTATFVRSGVVTFEAKLIGGTLSPPIKLTADGLNRASATESPLTQDVRSTVTTANGSQGQFFGAIHAEGKTVDFSTRREFDDFQNRLASALEKEPSQFREQWKVMDQTPTGNTGTKSSDGSGVRRGPPGGRAQKMLIEQLRSMQRQNQENAPMQELLEGMILQVEQGREN